MQRDYNNFDYLSVSVKNEELDKILYCYRILGWKEMRREDDKDDEDMKYLSLCRRHDMPNKDRLQYLQVRMESLINSLASIRLKSHVKSTMYAIITGICAYLFIACGLCLILLCGGTTATIFGLISFFICGGFIVWQSYFLLFVRSKERKAAEVKCENALCEIEDLIAEAAPLATQSVTESEIRRFFGEDTMSDVKTGRGGRL